MLRGADYRVKENDIIYVICRLNRQWTGFTTRIDGSMRKTWELLLLTSSSVATHHTWRSRIYSCLLDTSLMKWTSTCCPRSRTSFASSCLPGLWRTNRNDFFFWTSTKKSILCNRTYIAKFIQYVLQLFTEQYIFSFFSKVMQRAMKDMISHNYDRFAKVGSSSAFSGFMAREWQSLISKPEIKYIIHCFKT